MKRIQKKQDDSYYKGAEQRFMILKSVKIKIPKRIYLLTRSIQSKRVMSPKMAEGGFVGCFHLFYSCDTLQRIITKAKGI